jgi:hypothetical protein
VVKRSDSEEERRQKEPNALTLEGGRVFEREGRRGGGSFGSSVIYIGGRGSSGEG